jgi:hypothetical protein
MRTLCAAAGLESVEQKVHRGPAPFLLTEAVAPKAAIPAPHFAMAEAGVRAKAG